MCREKEEHDRAYDFYLCMQKLKFRLAAVRRKLKEVMDLRKNNYMINRCVLVLHHQLAFKKGKETTNEWKK